MKTINFCISFIGSGLRYAEFLVANLLATATHPERIAILLSAHSQSDVEVIKNSSLNDVVKDIVMAQAYLPPVGDSSRGERFVGKGVIGSANHCSAIQSLFDGATADVVIFSDHDMAFLNAGWDVKITEILETHDLCGVGYPSYGLPIPLEDIVGGYMKRHHYQNIPNLSFLAITRQCIEAHFPKGMSAYHHYLAKGGMPIQIVNTVQMSNALNLPVGAVWYMDSGYEIPFVIQNYNLKYHTFIPVAFHEQTIFSPEIFTESVATTYLPDVFVDAQSGEPFLAHYGHGTLKNQLPDTTPFDFFVAAVNHYLARRN